jgi:hypothetical protein
VKKAYTLSLSHRPNPDVNGGYWTDVTRPSGRTLVAVANLDEARRRTMDFVRRYELGSGNFSGGEVLSGGQSVAVVGYNGRVWDADGKEIVGQELFSTPKGE